MRPINDQDADYTRNPAAEREVIGSVIRSSAYVDDAMRLRAEDFTSNNHQTIWRAIAHLLDKGDLIRINTVISVCGNALDPRSREELESVVQMAGGTTGILNDAIAKVLDASKRRAAAAVYAQARKRAISSEDDIEKTISRATMEVEDAIQGNELGFVTGDDVNQKLKLKLQNPPPPVPTGFPKLDHVLEGGLWPTRMIAILAQTKVGKTTLAISISDNLLDIDEPHLLISLERNDLDAQQASAARALKINSLTLEREFGKYEKAFQVFTEDPRHKKRFYMHRPGATIEDVILAIRRAHRAGAKGFILDYWQLLERSPGVKENVNEHLSRCAQALSNVTNKLGMWGVVNAQSQADGTPRDCQALWLAASSIYVLRRDAHDKPDAWLQCLGSSFTKGFDAGSPGSPALMLDTEIGPYFRSA